MAVQFADNEMGRQARTLAGKTPANFYTWLIFQISHDAYRILTTLSLSMVFWAGLFGLLVCRELQLTALAGLIGALFLSDQSIHHVLADISDAYCVDLLERGCVLGDCTYATAWRCGCLDGIGVQCL
jgi:hypothetical protein